MERLCPGYCGCTIIVVLCIKQGVYDDSYLGAGDGAEWRKLLAKFLIIDGVIKVFNVQVDALQQDADTSIALL